MKKHQILLIPFSIWILGSDYLCRKKLINEYAKKFVFYVILNISFYLFFADAITRVTFCDVSLRFVLSIGKLTFPLLSGTI
jgi:hypothetical protein